MSRVRKKEDLFYSLLEDLCAELDRSGEAYLDIFESYPDGIEKIRTMKDIETGCDDKVHALLTKLYESFITPFDREDINELALKMDDVVDDMENISRRLEIFHVGSMRPEAVELARLANQGTTELRKMFAHLPNFKKDSVVIEQAHKIHEIEDQTSNDNTNLMVVEVARRIFGVEHAIARLYNENEAPATHLLKWNTIFNRMEDTVDDIKLVSTIVSNVVLKNA